MSKTKQTYSFTELSGHSDGHADSIQHYLEFLSRGDGKKAHCPFVKTMVAKRQFYYAVSGSMVSREEFSTAISEMEYFYHQLSDRYMVVCVVYENECNYSKEMAEKGESFKQEERLRLLTQGLTTAWTHPLNPSGTHTHREKPDYPFWITPAPMLLLRRLDKGDEPFMVTEESKHAFALGMQFLDICDAFSYRIPY